jgi:hypothetical protein
MPNHIGLITHNVFAILFTLKIIFNPNFAVAKFLRSSDEKMAFLLFFVRSDDSDEHRTP